MAKTSGRVYAGLAALLALALTAEPQAWGGSLPHYDLDSELYMASDAIEGTIIGSHAEQGFSVQDVEITRVHQGATKAKAQVMVAALDFYVKDADGSGRHETRAKLEKGDELIFFLVRAKESFAFNVPKDAVIYMPVPGGLRLVRDGKVYPFVQRDNPGPYVAVWGDYGKRWELASLEAYRDQIATRRKWVDAFRAEFDANKGDTDWLLASLGERVKGKTDRSSLRQDRIAEVLSDPLARTRNPEVLERAIGLTNEFFFSYTLTQGFATPAGREYILKIVGDATLPQERRVRLAAVLPWLWAEYDRSPEGQLKGDNGRYLERIARLALENTQQEPLCLTLATGLSRLADVVRQSHQPAVLNDWRQAVAHLAKLHAADPAPSQSILFEIEVALARTDPEGYQALGSRCGSVITKLTLADERMYGGVGPMMRLVDSSYYIFPSDKTPAPAQWQFVARHIATNTEYLLAANPIIRGPGPATGGSGGHPVSLPPDAPKGVYRVWLRGLQDDKVVSDGHWLELEFR